MHTGAHFSLIRSRQAYQPSTPHDKIKDLNMPASVSVAALSCNDENASGSTAPRLSLTLSDQAGSILPPGV